MLNARQQQFIAEYLVDLNATGAARRAGYSGSQRSIEVTGNRLLSHAEVRAAGAAALSARSAQLSITAADVVREAWALATGAKSESARVAALTLLARHLGMLHDSPLVDNRSQTLVVPPGTTLDEIRRLRDELRDD